MAQSLDAATAIDLIREQALNQDSCKMVIRIRAMVKHMSEREAQLLRESVKLGMQVCGIRNLWSVYRFEDQIRLMTESMIGLGRIVIEREHGIANRIQLEKQMEIK